MRRIQGSGVEVLSVDPGSASDVAGVEAGDVITTIGDIASPTAAQIRSAFAAVKRGDVVIAALTRGAEHRVVTLQR
jgi:S1-C subfamily serine protease